jgi:uncharacterized protein DUF4231
MNEEVTLARLEDQIKWYDTRSGYNQRMFKALKVSVVGAAALIPFMSGAGAPAWGTGFLGVVVVVLEAVQQLNQYHSNWMAYRSTAEALKHEKYLHAASAGPYASSDNPHALLAERIEGLVSQEHAKWVSAVEQQGKGKPQPTA